MRRARLTLAVAVLVLGCGATTAHALSPLQWKVRSGVAARYADDRAGHVGFAVIDHRGRYVGGHQPHRRFHSASVFKTMLAVCFLNDARVRGRALTAAEKSLLSQMIRRSSDPAANQIYGRTSQACIRSLAKRVGMRGFTTSSFWGRTQITPYGTARLFHRLDKLIVQRHRRQAMAWFRSVVPSQRWGLATVVPRGMSVFFKGGFAGSPGGGEIVSQGALFSAPNRHRFALAVLTNNSPGQPYGRETLRGVGQRLLHDYRPKP